MGADSSTLQSIESLNSTLNDIEKKLFVIEDVHLHHERTISHDDAVLISGKKIVCRSGVHILCGPVLGLIGTQFARILVEVDEDSELTFNVFITDNHLICTRFAFSMNLSAKKNVPSSLQIENLLPNTNYTVYIGGITPTETINNYVTFQTMPNETENIRMILLNNGRVEQQKPGETNLWKEIENRVLSPQSTPPAYYNPTASSSNIDIFTSPYIPNSTNTNTTNTTSSNTYTNPTATASPPPVHLVCHHGNLITIHHILHNITVELLDLLLREDSNFEDWVILLNKLEQQLKNAYRNALNSSNIQRIVRTTGNIFLIGEEEAGLVNTALLAFNLPEKLALKSINTEENMPINETNNDNNKIKRNKSRKKKNTTSANIDINISEENKNILLNIEKKESSNNNTTTSTAATATVENNITTTTTTTTSSSNIDNRAEEGDVSLTPVVGTAMRRFYDCEQQVNKSRHLVCENMRRILTGVIVRLLRYVLYCDV